MAPYSTATTGSNNNGINRIGYGDDRHNLDGLFGIEWDGYISRIRQMADAEIAEVKHDHDFVPHPKWITHLYCVICGMAIPRSMAEIARKNGAKVTE